MMSQYLETTKKWVERIVVGLNLCPFAKAPFRMGRIRYVVFRGKNRVELARLMIEEARHLAKTLPEETETTLLIHPDALQDFLDYNDFLDEADALIRENGLEGIIQVASFHPDYQFADVPHEAPENFTNRSPYPMLHLLREESIEKALEQYPDPEKIPERNIEKMKALGREGIEKLLNG